MSSNIVLTAALRNNLLSLKNTQTLIDKTQERLATGLKINSALDNPQSFFAAQSLNNRANDLSRLLDGIGQAVQTIKSADDAIKSLSNLLDQAESLAAEASTALDSSGGQATITGNIKLDGSTEFIDYTNVDAADEIRFTLTDANGKLISIDANTDDGDVATGNGVDISANETVDEVIAQINGIKEANTGDQVLEASLTSEGYLQIKSLKGGDLKLEFTNDNTANADLAAALGFAEYGAKQLNQTDATFAPNEYAVTVSKTPNLTSYTLYKSDGTVADRSTALTDLYFKDPNSSDALTALIVNDDTNDSITIGLNGDTATTGYEVISDAASQDVQDFIDGINNNALLKANIEASFNEATNQIEIRAIASTAKSIQLIAGGEAGTDAFTITDAFGFGIGADLAATDDGDADYDSESIAFGVGAGQLAQLESDYDSVLSQIDLLVQDASYRGTNLLVGDDLTVFFNREQSSLITVEGGVLSTGSSGLNIGSGNFSSITNIASATAEIRGAQDVVRNFASSLSTSLSIIQNREDFTKNQINTLKEGADKLTVADQNEEGANLLALQTRQALGTTALSLASQSAQSVLRLF